MEQALRLIPARTRLIIVDGAGHDLAAGNLDIQSVVSDLMKLTE
jgi:hypothetical protein